jgi:HEAT repeat protein
VTASPEDAEEAGQKNTLIVGRRRGVALAGHLGDEATARTGLTDAAGDVRATALGALARMGRIAIADLETGLDDPDPVVRRRACEISATIPGPAIASALHDADPLVVEAACFALGERGKEEARSVPALAQVATGHRDPMCREAAIAALGAIGDEAGLSTILAGLDDKPAIRRRAVIALAPFEGPEVDAALAKARTDRDWQVRQAAEDLS